jgi:hypothetical protein
MGDSLQEQLSAKRPCLDFHGRVVYDVITAMHFSETSLMMFAGN